MIFDDIYQIVEESSHESAFNREECQALYDLMHKLPPPALIVEIGVQYGRSLTVLCEVAKEKGYTVTAIDKWQEDVSPEARTHIKAKAEKYGWPVVFWDMDSSKAAQKYDRSIALIHIDGNHDYQAVSEDCRNWLPKIIKGGYACFDDFGHDSLPGVYPAVKEYMAEHPEFRFIGRFGNKLGVYQKNES